MPSIDSIPLPPPQNWQDFEALCADLFTYEWEDKNLVRYGRSGQRQNGVDIYGCQQGQERLSAVQCKGRTSWPPRQLTIAGINKEIKNALTFKPPLAHYYMVTTGPDDQKIDDHVREITETHKASKLFEVHFLGWRELSQRIRRHPSLLEQHYEFVRVGALATKIEELTREVSALRSENKKEGPAISRDQTEIEPEPRIYPPAQVEQCERTFTAVSADLLHYPRCLINGTSIVRHEVKQILNDILGRYSDRSREPERRINTPTAHLVTGPAGSGKSSLLAELAIELSTIPDVQILGLKAELLPANVNSVFDLGNYLNLPLPLVDAVKTVAASKIVVVLIDQLDSLASYLDLSTGRLTALLNFVRAVADIPNVFVVLSCREFEHKHDTRLNSLQARQHHLALPEWAAVSSIIENAGVETSSLSDASKELLRSPHALNVFLQLGANRITIQSFHALLDELWRSQINPLSNNAASFLTQLANDIATDETLIQAKSRYPGAAAVISNLISTGFLKEHNTVLSIGFAHQTYFEHALAKFYAADPDSLVSYVRPRIRSLFIRPKLLTALSYLRESYGASSPSYLRPLNEIWQIASKSPHLQHLLVEFIGSQPAPSGTEVSLVSDIAGTRPEALRLVVRHTAGSDGWFEAIRSTILEKVMKLPAAEAAVALDTLAAATRKAPDSVADLLSKYWTVNSDYHRLAWFVLANAHGWSEALTSVAVDLAKRQLADRHFLDATTSRIADDHPIAALQIIAAYISTATARIRNLLTESAYSPGDRVDFSLQQSIRKEFETLDSFVAIPDLAAQRGKDFLLLLWPGFEDLFETIEVEGNFADWGFRSFGHDSVAFSQHATDEDDDEGDDDYRPSGASTALDSLVTAAVAFWQADPTGFADWLQKIEKADSLFIQRMIALIFAAIGAPMTDSAARFLSSDPRRFLLGSNLFSNRTGTTVRLIKAITPYLGAGEISRLEAAVVSTFPPPSANELTTGQRASREIYDRASLLNAIGKSALSPEAKAVLAADEAKVGTSQPFRARSGWVGSPMTRSDMGSSSNTEIINLFETLVDSTDWDNPDVEKRFNLQGGSIQASREFAAFARSQPERAVAIIDQFQKGGQERPAGYAIAALAGQSQDGPSDQQAPVDPELVMKVIRKCVAKEFDHPEFRGSVSSAIDHLSRREVHVPEDMIGLLESWLSTPASEPDEEDELESLDTANPSARNEDSKDKEREFKSGIIWDSHRFEMLPGGTFQFLDALSNILLSKPQRDSGRWLDILERHLSREEDLTVWSSLLRFFEYVETENRPRASELIATLYEKYPALALRASTVRLLARIHWWLKPELLRRLTENFAASDSQLTRQGYGELIGLFAIVKSESAPWAIEQLNDLLEDQVDSQRPVWVGVTLSAAHLFGHKEFSDQAGGLLTRAIDTHDYEVLDAAFEVFRVTDQLAGGNQTKALLCAVERAIQERISPDPTFLVEHLERLLPEDPALVASICSTLVRRAGSDLGNFSTSLASIAPNLVNIALTLHRSEGEIGQRGLHLFEALLEVEAYGAQAALIEIDDRPVRAQSRPVRTRKFHRPRRRRRKPV